MKMDEYTVQCSPSLRSMAILVVRTNKLRRTKAVKPRGGMKRDERAFVASALSSRPDKATMPRRLNATQKGQ